MSNLDTGYDSTGSAKTYSTVQAALAVASDYDQIRVYYKANNRDPVWFMPTGEPGTTASGVFVGIEGMLPRQKVVLLESSGYTWDAIMWYINLSTAKSSDVYVRNLTMGATIAYRKNCITYNNTSNTNTGKVVVERCKFFSFNTSVRLYDYAFADVVYSLSVGSQNAFSQVTAPSGSTNQTRFCNCGTLVGNIGYRIHGSQPDDYRPLVFNCFSIGAYSGTMYGDFHADSDNNYTPDVGTITQGDLVFQQERSGVRPWLDVRPQSHAANLVGQGGTYVGLTQDYDIDGRYIDSQPIGPSIGVDFNGSTYLEQAAVGTVDSKIR